MATGGDLGTHGELAIGNAQMGMRQDDMPVRIGFLVWAVLGLGGWISSYAFLPESAVLPVWAVVLIVICSGIIAVNVSVVLYRSNARNREKALAEMRAIDAAEKRRQMNEFRDASNRKKLVNSGE